MMEHRKVTSAQGLAIVQRKKKDGKGLKTLLDMYAESLFQKGYDSLSEVEKNKVHYAILESSGRDNAKFTTGTKKMLIMGKLGVLVTAALATYQILDAENKPKEAARQGIIVGAGALGGMGIPCALGHPVHEHLDSDSTLTWTLIPRALGQ
ncbi:hypothetical protein ACYZTM_02985 [Pseudomonas sp. MDT2-39-1]